MAYILEGLHQEHEELWPRIEAIKEAGDLIDLAPVEVVIHEVEEIDQFLTLHLIPHARAEEEVLYRAYDQVAASPWASETMRKDHAEVVKLRQALVALRLKLFTDPLTSEQKQEARQILYALHALLKLHFEKEEELLIPRIESGLTEEGAHQLIESMEKAVTAYRDALTE
jgi:hemerythrin-like domain-containing protein